MHQNSAGDTNPLGARIGEGGVNFALFSLHADAVELCLFGEGEDEQRYAMHRTDDCWHLFVETLGAGQQYAYRVHGPWAPESGHRFNPAKIVLDPYARKLSGPVNIHPTHYDYQLDAEKNLVRDLIDNAPFMPKCIVCETGCERPGRASEPAVWDNALLYELHVKGFTQKHPLVADDKKGRYEGLVEPGVVEYVKNLGVTSIELLPVQEFVDEPFVSNHGLVNYWGYNPLLFFAPTERYARQDAILEFKLMVQALHDANIEVILDVVYNHTAEANELGPTYCYRGIDNVTYYRLDNSHQGQYINDSGCGNALNVSHPAVLKMVMDSLRFWVSEMGVDGFRFDLATGLGRSPGGYSIDAPFFQAVYQDPVLSQARLIAEPWDMGLGGYQLGNFPRQWSEWNDRYRDTVRRYWRGDEGVLGDYASYLHGSSELFEHSGRPPQAGINFVTSHDGFTLRDLVSFEQKHNEANLEDNRDGHDHNYSFNSGAEGPVDNPGIEKLRFRQQRNLLMTLLVSQGVPMLLAGDELGRTQQGNNNAYCQDNDINWLDWSLAEQPRNQALLDFTRRAIAVRQSLPELSCARFIHGSQYDSYEGLDEIAWYHPRGTTMLEADWHDSGLKTLGLMLHGEDIYDGSLDVENLIFILFSASSEPIEAVLPVVPFGGNWQCRLSTADDVIREGRSFEPGCSLTLQEKSAELYVFEGDQN